ncbi:MAG: hypothetical protein NWS47_01570 [Alphaproteobacteria bacterium]|nr:hypothetical protein [Alphaproteobacteria bacterium]
MNFYYREKQLKRYFKSYIKSLSFIFLSVNLAFASNAVDAIIEHHTQRRILENKNIDVNKSSIKQESDAITGILTTTTVDTKRHASDQEKFHILRAVVGERIAARLTEIKTTGSFSAKSDSNPYSAILKNLTSCNTDLRNHYRVLELTYNLGDSFATSTSPNVTIKNMTEELLFLTGTDYCFFGCLIESVFWEHHLVTCDQVTQNIFELFPQFEQRNKSWLGATILASVAEIKDHPLSKFASIFSHSNDPQEILESLNSIWGQKYSPYQFSAAKFLVLYAHPSFWSTGIKVLSNIDQYIIGSPDHVNLKMLRDPASLRKDLRDTLEKIKKTEDLISIAEKEMKMYEENKGLDEEEQTKRINLSIENLTQEFEVKNQLDLKIQLLISLLPNFPLSHPQQLSAHDFLYIEQWDRLIAISELDAKLLENEINLAKNIMAQNNASTQTQVTTKGLLNKFLSSKEVSSRFDEIKFKLLQYLMHTPISITYIELLDSVTNIDEAVQTAVA